MTWTLDSSTIILEPPKFSSDNPRADFLHELRRLGYQQPPILEVGKIMRFNAPKDRKKAGWAIYHEYDVDDNIFGVASFGDWREDSTHRWVSQQEDSLTFEQKRKLSDAYDRSQIEIAKEKAIVAAQRLEYAKEIWAKATICTDHPYMVRKNVAHYDKCKVDPQGRLLVPAYNQDFDLQTLQRILPEKPPGENDKKFLWGLSSKDCFHKIDGDESRIFICEGLATGLSVNQATGDCVYVAFSTGNLMGVTSIVKKLHPDSMIVIAGDDDPSKKVNNGRHKATEAAEAYGTGLAFPTTPTDFNDMAAAEGMDSVTKLLARSETPKAEQKTDTSMPDHLLNIPGALGEAVRFYNVKSTVKQPEWAVLTALALGSLVTGRWFRTTGNDYSILYFLIIGDTSTGKDDVEKILPVLCKACDLERNCMTNSYTSEPAVHTRFMIYPRTLTIIDEFGLHLEAEARDSSSKFGNTARIIMKLATQAGKKMDPMGYSGMTLSKEDREGTEDKAVYSPHHTMMGMTTPGRFFDAITSKMVDDGYLNRFLIGFTDKESEPVLNPVIIDAKDVSPELTAWAKRIESRKGFAGDVFNVEPEYRNIKITDEANKLYQEYAIEANKRHNKMKRAGDGLAACYARAAEWAKRVALIVALSKDANTWTLDVEEMQWGIDFMKYATKSQEKLLRRNIGASKFERDKKQTFAKLRTLSSDTKDGWVEMAVWARSAPLNKMTPRERKDIIDSILDDEYAEETSLFTTKTAKKPKKYYRPAV